MERCFSAAVFADVPETQQKSVFTFLIFIFLIKANEVKGPEPQGESALT